MNKGLQRTILIIIYLFSLNTYAFSQDYTTKGFDKSDSTKNYYVVYQRPAQINGVLILLSSFGEPASKITAETDIVNSAISHGLFTFSLSLQDGQFSFYIDSTSQATIGKMISDIYESYHLTNKKLYVGGFSLGGSGAVRYYEKAIELSNLIKPSAVFAIDPPLDFVRYYNSLNKLIQTSSDAQYFIPRLKYEFKGSPTENYTSYLRNSPFIFDDSASKISLLKNSPLLLITEPDIEWQLNNRGRDYYDLNSFDCASVIKNLHALGNSDAVLVTTTNKGYRKVNNQRNPHSWSIADPEMTIKWLLKY